MPSSTLSCAVAANGSVPKISNRFKPNAYSDIFLAEGFKIPALSVRHIFHGDLQTEQLGQSRRSGSVVVALDGGLHTQAALVDFLYMRSDVAKYIRQNPQAVKFDENDVMAIKLPENAFTQRCSQSENASRVNSGPGIIKSLFPRSWKDEKILDAIRACATSGKILSMTSTEQIKIITYENVLVKTVLFKEGPGWNVFTAYPLSRDQ